MLPKRAQQADVNAKSLQITQAIHTGQTWYLQENHDPKSLENSPEHIVYWGFSYCKWWSLVSAHIQCHPGCSNPSPTQVLEICVLEHREMKTRMKLSIIQVLLFWRGGLLFCCILPSFKSISITFETGKTLIFLILHSYLYNFTYKYFYGVIITISMQLSTPSMNNS